MARKKQDVLDDMRDSAEPGEKVNYPEPPLFTPVDPPAQEKKCWRFVSNTYPALSIGFKGELHRFENGALVTCDPEFATALEKHPWFKVHFHRG